MFGFAMAKCVLIQVILKFLDLFLYFHASLDLCTSMTFFSFLCLYVHVRRKKNMIKFDIRDVCMWNFPLQLNIVPQ